MFKTSLAFAIAWAAFVITAITAYINHIIWAVSTLMNDATTSQIVLAIIGSVIPPLGVIHGVVLWFS